MRPAQHFPLAPHAKAREEWRTTTRERTPIVLIPTTRRIAELHWMAAHCMEKGGAETDEEKAACLFAAGVPYEVVPTEPGKCEMRFAPAVLEFTPGKCVAHLAPISKEAKA